MNMKLRETPRGPRHESLAALRCMALLLLFMVFALSVLQSKVVTFMLLLGYFQVPWHPLGVKHMRKPLSTKMLPNCVVLM